VSSVKRSSVFNRKRQGEKSQYNQGKLGSVYQNSNMTPKFPENANFQKLFCLVILRRDLAEMESRHEPSVPLPVFPHLYVKSADNCITAIDVQSDVFV